MAVVVQFGVLISLREMFFLSRSERSTLFLSKLYHYPNGSPVEAQA
jgi:hypothetical protein